MPEKIEKFWDGKSGTYGFMQWESGAIQRFDYELTRDALLKFLDPSKNDRILEIGCGPGRWTKLVSGMCKSVTAVDISSGMIREARKNCKSKNVRFIHGNFMKMELAGIFDKIFAVRAIEYIKDKGGMLDRFNSLLRRGGRVVAITKSRPCLWDLTRKVGGFWQEKVSCRCLEREFGKHGFCDMAARPVIIRLPIFASGNREFPIIGKRCERRALNFFRRLTRASAGMNRRLMFMPMLFSESYLLCARKA